MRSREELRAAVASAYYSQDRDPGALASGHAAAEEFLHRYGWDSEIWMNRCFYVPSLSREESYLSFCPRRLHVGVERPRWSNFNPSALPMSTLVFVRSSNYIIHEGSYYYADGGDLLARDRLTRTDYYVLDTENQSVLPVMDRTSARGNRWACDGWEDMRPYRRAGFLYASASTRMLREDGLVQLCELRLEQREREVAVVAFRVLSPIGPEMRHEKNWAPIISDQGEMGGWLYGWDPVCVVGVDGRLREVPATRAQDPRLRHCRGGTHLVWSHFLGRYLGVVHEVTSFPGGSERVYLHRFVTLDRNFVCDGVSAAFFFGPGRAFAGSSDRRSPTIEYAAGLSIDSGVVTVTYGWRDAEAWMHRLYLGEVEGMLT